MILRILDIATRTAKYHARGLTTSSARATRENAKYESMPRTRHATDPTGQAGVMRLLLRAQSSPTLELRLRTTKYHARGLGYPTSFAQGKTAKYRALMGVASRLAS